MSDLQDEFYIEIVAYEDESVIERRGPFNRWKADKVDDGLNINLHHEKFFTRIVEGDKTIYSGKKVTP